jgi:GH24 family phage-related lysozyme (muramidase)
MNISDKGLKFIMNYEGCRLTAYKPVAAEKYWTIGWGHYGPDIKEGQKITQAQADQMFRNDIQGYVAGVLKLVKVPINQNQLDALCSFAYNCGVGALQKSTMLKYINAGDFQSAANEFPRYCHGAGGIMLQGLLNRRNKEREVFLTPVQGGDDEMKFSKEEIDFILSVLSYYWGQMKGNKKVQDYTHLIADRVREERQKG